MSKKLLVLGATGGTGRQVVAQALEAGHEVTAFARRVDPSAARRDRLRHVPGDVTTSGSLLTDAMKGQDAVISAIGRGNSLKSEGLIQRSIPLILSAMKIHGVRRLIFTSALGVGTTIRDAPLFSRVMARVLLRDIFADKLAGEDLIRKSGLDWTIVQPALLTGGPLTRRYRSGERLSLRGIPKISRADVAHCLLAQLDDHASIGKVILIAGGPEPQ